MTILWIIVWALPFVGMGLLLWALRRLERQGTHHHRHIKQRHHGYYGFLMVLGGAILLSTSVTGLMVLGGLLYAFGMWWLIDDSRQHRKQFKEPGFYSPWHRWAHSKKLI